MLYSLCECVVYYTGVPYTYTGVLYTDICASVAVWTACDVELSSHCGQFHLRNFAESLRTVHVASLINLHYDVRLAQT